MNGHTDYSVHKIPGWYDEHRNESLANVHLMTVAPELLEALKAVLATHTVDATGSHAAHLDGWLVARSEAVAAIAKAEGGGA